VAIGTPNCFFYTGKPPTILGGLHPKLRFICPFLVFNGRSSVPVLLQI